MVGEHAGHGFAEVGGHRKPGAALRHEAANVDFSRAAGPLILHVHVRDGVHEVAVVREPAHLDIVGGQCGDRDGDVLEAFGSLGSGDDDLFEADGPGSFFTAFLRQGAESRGARAAHEETRPAHSLVVLIVMIFSPPGVVVSRIPPTGGGSCRRAPPGCCCRCSRA